MKNRIEWRGWINPYTKDENKEYASEEEAEAIFAKGRYSDGYDEKDEDEDRDYRLAVPSPRGAIPITIYHDFTESQLWRGDTNFVIDDVAEDIINTTLGVARLTVYDPYTFIIAVGRLFNSADVKVAIQKQFNAMPAVPGEINPAELELDGETKAKVDALKSQMTNKHWAIIVFPNGNMEPLMTDDKDVYNANIKKFLEAQEVTGAIIFTNVS